MPTAKFIIENPTPGRRREISRLAGTGVTDYHELSQKYSLADMGVQVGCAADAWELAHQAGREMLGQFVEPDFPSGFHVNNTTTVDGRGLAVQELPHPHDQVAGDVKGPCFGWHRLDQFAQLERARVAADLGFPRDVRVAICDVGFDCRSRHLSQSSG